MMSDFLSQFEGKSAKPAAKPAAQPALQPTAAQPDSQEPLTLQPGSQDTGRLYLGVLSDDSPEAVTAASGGIKAIEHHVEIDRGYRSSRIRLAIIIAMVAVLVVLAGILVWHFSRQVEIPDFTGKSLAMAQTFCRDNGLTIDASEEFSLTAEQNTVISQGVDAGKKIGKGSVLSLVVSKGPDPQELLALPDFSTMKRAAAEQWMQANRADSMRLVLEYSDSVAKDDFMRLEFNAEDVGEGNYRRRDYATLYYSKGAESFAKNITVPDYAGKAAAEVEEWAKKNGLVLSVSEAESDTVPQGQIISQSVAAGEKLAKNDSFAIVVSLGKPLVVPNFANYTHESAGSAAEQIPISIEMRFHATVAYGRLISQSVPAGTRMFPNDVKRITLVYSLGMPFLKSYLGMSEGDLPAAFFNDYTVKGARVSYTLVYVDSYEPKGSVVGMSDHSRFIPLDFHVVIEISRGNLTPPTPPTLPAPVDPPIVGQD